MSSWLGTQLISTEATLSFYPSMKGLWVITPGKGKVPVLNKLSITP
jgi:hypothetical protein